MLSGIAAAVFLILLDWATNTRLAHREIIWGVFKGREVKMRVRDAEGKTQIGTFKGASLE